MPIINPFSRKDIKDEGFASSFLDVFAFCLVFSILFVVIYGISHFSKPYRLGHPFVIHLDWVYLPFYAWRSALRMLIAWFFSLVFSLVVGAWAAKSRAAERVLIPLIDILQSVPILSFLPVGVWFFLRLFPHSMFGPECASIFLVFTAQVWNITLAFYQSLRSMPYHFHETASIFHLGGWRKFWHMEVPYALPGLVWNSMLSLSAGWFFIVASEAIVIDSQSIQLPGIGSYIQLAITQGHLYAIFEAILAMLVVIFCYNQLLLKPLFYWSMRFKMNPSEEDRYVTSWFARLLARAHLLHDCLAMLGDISRVFFTRMTLTIAGIKQQRLLMIRSTQVRWVGAVIKYSLCLALFLWFLFVFYHYVWLWIGHAMSMKEMGHVVLYGGLTALRVIVLVVVCVLFWTPIGVWIGLRPKVAMYIQPFIQFLSALPANLFYPLLFMLIIYYRLNIDFWSAPLMVLGMQWYILFNVIGGALSLDGQLKETIHLLQLRPLQRWRYFILPGIFPDLLTGMITAAGGAWNASIIAELVDWHGTQISAHGLGAYIQQMENMGHFPQLAFGTMVMSTYVLLINHFFWQPLYRYVKRRFQH